MAINRFNTYPGKLSAPTTERPFGGFQNRSTPTANDGSPFEKQWINDILGFFDSLLKDAQPEIVPNGAPDEVGASQYLAGLISIIEQNAGSPPDATELVKGIGKIATQLIAETGTDDAAFMTSLKTKQSIDKNVPDATEILKGKARRATSSEVATGTEATAFVTPATLQSKLNTLGGNVNNVTSSRSGGVTYTNTYGKTMYLSVIAQTAAGTGASILVNGTKVAEHVSYHSNNPFSVFAVVPAGKTYRVNLGSSTTINTWIEYR